ncbi:MULTISPECIES: hypothetical protein [unclassified Oceanispirochaeta]|uniref:hypothetical protein n=1 Tax=unclassified Oceanispirochaeta TaxID=2635722 RepID=UPI000E096290|nr:MULTISPECIES: hypothetical protein [unclassified Oceanispirochaeta]MBF9016369.1 hypothetical protein [Oceanispirochaeta sp. M2]NPD72831.1 hypothetical protein [Oceanispirochaeta sp. M1]RDG31675.1 hypothetical protein DV872_12035 [Oceanispirochaeta sp. M1]
MKIRYLLPLWLLIPHSLTAVTLEELFQNARTKDQSLEAMNEEDIQRLNRYKLEDLEQGWQYGLSSGEIAHEQSRNDDNTLKLSAAPSTSLTLPYPLETNITLGSPFILDMSEGTDYSVTGELKVKQPLNGIFGIERDERLKMEQRDKESFESDLNRFRHLRNREQSVVNHLITIYNKEKELLDLRTQELRKSLVWETAVRFGTIASGTKAELTLKMELNKISRDKLQLQQTINEAKQSLEYLTGVYLTDLPELPDFSLPVLPMDEKRMDAAQLKLQRWEVVIKQNELRETKWRELPQIALTGGIEAKGDQKDGTAFSVNDQKGSFGLESIGETVDIRGGAKFGENEFGINGSFSWKTKDRRKDRLEEKIKDSEVKQQTMILEDLYPDHFEKEQAVITRINNLRLRKNNTAEDFQIAEQALKEQSYSHDKGFISDMELEESRIALDILKYEQLLLTLESENLQLDIDKYYFTDERKDY